MIYGCPKERPVTLALRIEVVRSHIIAECCKALSSEQDLRI